MATPYMDSVCARCGREYGDHFGTGNQTWCPNAADKQDKKSLGFIDVWTLDYDKRCRSCGKTRGAHSSNSVGRTFCVHKGVVSRSPFCLQDDDEEAITARSPSFPKKNYGSECPCGIHPNACSYHREG